MSASNYLETKIYDLTLRGVAFTPPSVFVALYSTDPTDADTGTEISGGAYARQSAAFAAPTNGGGGNSAIIQFPAATAGYTATHFGIRDATSGGNLLYHGALTASKTVAVGDQLVFQPGELTVTVS